MACSRSRAVLAIVAVTVVALATSANAGIIIDSQTTINGPGGAISTANFGSYDASGSDKLVVLVGGGRDRGSSLDIASVTYGNTTLTEAVKVSSTTISPQGVAAGIYYLDSPGAAGDLEVNFSAKSWGIRNAITVLGLSGAEAGVGPVGSSANSASASLTTLANDSLVLAISKAVPDGDTEVPQSPLTDLLASRIGSGYQFVASPATVSPTFSTGHATVAAAFAPVATGGGPVVLFGESFEDPDVPATGERSDGWTNVNPTGWSKQGHPNYTGLADENTTTAYKFSTPDGEQAAWVYGNGSMTTTDAILDAVLEAAKTYTVSFNAAKPSNGSDIEYIVELLAGDQVLASVLGLANSSDMSITDGFSYTSAAGDPNLGETLAIRLKKGAGAWQYNPLFDNVQLTAAPVGGDIIPEPATLSLLGLGALLALRRRRRSR